MTSAIAAALSNYRRNDRLTDTAVEACIAALAGHPRVDAVERADDDPWGRAQVRIVARDTARGDLDRVIVLVDVLHDMRLTRAEQLAIDEKMERTAAAVHSSPQGGRVPWPDAQREGGHARLWPR